MLASLALLLQGCTSIASQLKETSLEVFILILLIEGRRGVNPIAKLPAFFPFPKEIYQPPSVMYPFNSQELAISTFACLYFNSNPMNYVFSHLTLL